MYQPETMRCPTLKDLPPPPAGKTGWPWTDESEQLPDRMQDGREWPRISIVTCSYNQGCFIEETIRSVLLQGYPNLEYIIIDGESKDESVDIIRKYGPWLTHWESVPDKGQSNKVNSGMNRASGEIVAWINSDDVYLPEAMSLVGQNWKPGRTHWLVGKIIVGESINSDDITTPELSTAQTFVEIACFWMIRERKIRTFPQPSVFFSKTAWTTVDGLSEAIEVSMDSHLWAKLSAFGYVPVFVPEKLSFFRVHPGQKTDPSSSAYTLSVKGVRAWSIYDGLRIARQRGVWSPDFQEAAELLELNAGGYCRVLDAHFSRRGRFSILRSLVWASLTRPRTTLNQRSRAVMQQVCRSN